MPRFYVNIPLDLDLQVNMPEDTVRHINVLRLRITDSIILFNGDGNDYLAEFIVLEKRKIIVKIVTCQIVNNESNLQLTLLMSIIASDKFDLVLQKSVELGVTNFIPIYTQNTQRFKNDKLESRIEHWQKIIIASSEQSGRSRLMDLSRPQDFAQIITTIDAESKFILSPHHAGNAIDQQSSSVALLVGPEGGFTLEEVTLANQAGFNSWCLGKRILRAETAAIAGTSLLQAYFGDF